MKLATTAAAVVLVAFTAFSIYPIYKEGYFGFLAIHAQGPWGVQVLIDLVISLSLFQFWMIPDARRRGLPAWPFFLATLFLGSIGALSYLVVRGLKSPQPAEG
ncbi:MAG: hypothetical protein QM820_28405 [Minicystis sp.]